MVTNKTFMAKPGTIERKWYLIDAAGKPLGRLAAEVAKILQGKHRPTYTPHVDTGDFVVVINADKVVLTGKKDKQSFVYRHSGYKGGLKAVPFGVYMEKAPDRLVEKVVKGMLPKTKLKFHKKLKVYAGPNHPHAAQKPEKLEI
ncbi:LSU ribosomal protein L13P [Thermovirga lienii DSM 17291]|jgi:large subunit ribosomal protein L13|uniref:Large ribosomal subunit protein uL13 n=1 Tax=Thermovirga lienii (strain ATCC BAA-1197 / DSM 17291 / Cas60314) TaxID=580340 RepID=G7V7K4_THELD|nr:50S ribosomal protein L13 [Thermovirga lienii]AER66166.1 LSU ribosomal protein L13P [Thermovirga lienii DSM 17291]MDN5318921.1 large subunit ribosomal protein [Thermovirga sp.]MDN5368020.1 large subunit ribosomal protein [Thermovirga sp.]HCD71185.1 50S ribosomal protein L13 [Thermovirga lienii]